MTLTKTEINKRLRNIRLNQHDVDKVLYKLKDEFKKQTEILSCILNELKKMNKE